MKSKRILMPVLILFLWIMIGQVSYAESNPEPDVWDGTIEQPTETIKIDTTYYYKITKASELAYIAQTGGDWLDYNYILYNDIILNDVEFSVNDNGELINEDDGLLPWLPIGYGSGYFHGIFDGNGYSVSGMYIDGDYTSLGLFSSSSGKIKNIDVKNAYILITSKKGWIRTGGIAASVSGSGSQITNCSFSGTITKGNTSYAEYTGGIVGLVGSACHVTNCNNYGIVIMDSSGGGGIAGKIENGYVTSCTNYGDVTGSKSLGGIVSSIGSGGNVESSINYGNVAGSGNRIGGIAGVGSGGQNSSYIHKCQNLGFIKGATQVGGIIGWANKGDSAMYGTNVSDSVNKSSVQGDSYVGGVAGQCDKSNIARCFSTGNVVGESETGALIGTSTHMSGAGNVSGCYYLKTSMINTLLSGVGNGADDEGVIMPCALVLVEAKASTCTTKGNAAYWKCNEIGTYYSDEGGLNEVEKNSWVLDADPTNHTCDNWVITKEPGCTIEGSKEGVCIECGNKLTEPIEALGHDFATTFTVDTEPTCTTEGSKSKHCANCDEVTEVTSIPANGHSFSEEFTVDTEPTCTADGSKSRHCSNCDEVTDVTVIPANGHEFAQEFTVDTEPTCTAEGSKSRHCANCDEVTDVTVIPAKGHEFAQEFTVDTEPTCTAEGSKSRHCANCDEVADVTTIAKTEHPYGDWRVTVEATCTEDGSKEKVCSVCGDKVTEVIPAKGHTWNEEYTTDKAATCKEEGSKSIHCSVCDAVDETTVTVIPKADHTYGGWTVTAEATCTEDGSKEKVCSVCGDKVVEVVPAKGHSFSEEFTVDTDPTCTEDGSKSKHCANCDAVTEVTAIPANGHSFGSWEVINASTCENSGAQQRVCGTCGFIETQDLDPNGHEWEEELTVDVEATCTEDGSRSRHCKNCDAVIDSEVIPATGHSGEWKVVKDSTCTEVGSKERICAVCGNKTVEEIPAKGHSWNSEPTVDKAATCTAAGSQSVHCARCSETKDAETIPALGHNWESTPTVDKAPTCTKDGKESTHCTRCDAIKEGSEKAIPATGHKFSAWETTKQPTELAPGQQSRKCSVCGKTETKTIAQLKPTLPTVKIAKPKAAKKSATIKWKKVSKANQKKIAKIQIQYSTDKTFKAGVKTVTAKKTAASKKITKLKSKKTYYVRIRAYKSSGGVVHVSKWSTVKSVKAK